MHARTLAHPRKKEETYFVPIEQATSVTPLRHPCHLGANWLQSVKVHAPKLAHAPSERAHARRVTDDRLIADSTNMQSGVIAS